MIMIVLVLTDALMHMIMLVLCLHPTTTLPYTALGCQLLLCSVRSRAVDGVMLRKI